MDQGSSKVTVSSKVMMTLGWPGSPGPEDTMLRMANRPPISVCFYDLCLFRSISFCRTRTSLYLSLPPLLYHIFANHNGAQSLGTSRHQKGSQLLALSRPVRVHLSHLRFKGVYQALGVFPPAQSKLWAGMFELVSGCSILMPRNMPWIAF